MTAFRTNESGKVLVALLLLINVVLVVVIMWLLRRPDLQVFVPSSGKTDYILAVNGEDQPRIYTPDGIPWEFCKQGECDDLPTDISCGSPDQKGFVLVNFSRSDIGTRPVDKAAALSDLIIPSAFAQTKDGDCPRIGYKNFAGTLIPQYPPTSVDADCPPQSK